MPSLAERSKLRIDAIRTALMLCFFIGGCGGALVSGWWGHRIGSAHFWMFNVLLLFILTIALMPLVYMWLRHKGRCPKCKELWCIHHLGKRLLEGASHFVVKKKETHIVHMRRALHSYGCASCGHTISLLKMQRHQEKYSAPEPDQHIST